MSLRNANYESELKSLQNETSVKFVFLNILETILKYSRAQISLANEKIFYFGTFLVTLILPLTFHHFWQETNDFFMKYPKFLDLKIIKTTVWQITIDTTRTEVKILVWLNFDQSSKRFWVMTLHHMIRLWPTKVNEFQFLMKISKIPRKSVYFCQILKILTTYGSRFLSTRNLRWFYEAKNRGLVREIKFSCSFFGISGIFENKHTFDDLHDLSEFTKILNKIWLFNRS